MVKILFHLSKSLEGRCCICSIQVSPTKVEKKRRSVPNGSNLILLLEVHDRLWVCLLLLLYHRSEVHHHGVHEVQKEEEVPS